VWRGSCLDEAEGRRTLHIVEKPEDIVIVVAGGAGNLGVDPRMVLTLDYVAGTRTDGTPIPAGRGVGY
jgi:hypothetical protein